eukprot:250251-Hanusia_phi.AAC.1
MFTTIYEFVSGSSRTRPVTVSLSRAAAVTVSRSLDRTPRLRLRDLPHRIGRRPGKSHPGGDRGTVTARPGRAPRR